MLFIIIMGGWTTTLQWRWQGHRKSQHRELSGFRGQFWWKGGMGWEGFQCTGCNMGDGEGINGIQWWRSAHPLPTCEPAGGWRGGEQPGRRSLEGDGGVQGFLGKFSDWFHLRSHILNFLWAVVWPCQQHTRLQLGGLGVVHCCTLSLCHLGSETGWSIKKSKYK